jgi:hypothetical protein
MIEGSGSISPTSGSGSGSPGTPVVWIRIRIDFDGLEPDPQLGMWILTQKDKNDYKNRKKVKKFNVLKCWMFSFEG